MLQDPKGRHRRGWARPGKGGDGGSPGPGARFALTFAKQARNGAYRCTRRSAGGCGI